MKKGISQKAMISVQLLGPVTQKGAGGGHVDHPGLDQPNCFDLLRQLFRRVGLQLDPTVGTLFQQLSEILEGPEPGVVFSYQKAGT